MTAVSESCPPLKTYTNEQLDQAQGELEKLPKGSMVGKMVVDYGITRNQLRACVR